MTKKDIPKDAFGLILLREFNKDGQVTKEVSIDQGDPEEERKTLEKLKEENLINYTTAENKETHNYSFRKKGGYWDITYQGENFLLKDTIGLHYITLLLRNPRTDFHVLDFEQKANPKSTSQDIQPGQLLNKEKEIDTSNYSLHEGMVDKKTLQTIENHLEELEQQQREAEHKGYFDKSSELEEEIEKIQKYKKNSTNQKGKPGKFSDEREKARKRITKAISTAMEKIKDQDSNLWRHLHNNIHKGYTCVYRPEDDLPWEF